MQNAVKPHEHYVCAALLLMRQVVIYIVCDISVSIAERQSLHECKKIFRLASTEIVVPRFQCFCFKNA